MLATARRIRTRPRGNRGVAAIEFIIIFPILLLLFIGAINITQFMTVNQKVKAAAELAADLITRNKDTIQTADIDDYFTAVELSLRPIDFSKVRVDVYNFYRKNNTDDTATERWRRSSPTGTACSSPNTASTSPLSKLVTSQTNDVVLAVVCLPFSMPGGNILGLGSLFNNKVIERQMLMGLRESQTLCISAKCT
ncbi:TadE/TadG family type IV pilus assembly protein [Aestuariivirga sp.]|uniref:TadE/TadG family type IV pilus assembly protein n=1 Tax=Aestuariivirga sp. TaxID=2650926 RepID=UPI0025BB5A39|nr:TadE/TadG family type IV pilus assembly protein [Aestuariivirga sp.]MCA3556240.1 pilus assembly protein [Aestuariivirga sp.]